MLTQSTSFGFKPDSAIFTPKTKTVPTPAAPVQAVAPVQAAPVVVPEKPKEPEEAPIVKKVKALKLSDEDVLSLKNLVEKLAGLKNGGERVECLK